MALRLPGAVVAILVVIGVAGAGDLLTVASDKTATRPAVQASVTANALRVTLTSGSTDVPLHVVAGSLWPDRPVDVIVDSAYPTLLTTAKSSKGIYDHLAVVLPDGGWTGPVRRIDAKMAAADIAGDPGRILVSASGTLPDTLVGPAHDFAPLHDWLAKGGELVFLGDGIGYWAGHAGDSGYSLSDSRARIDWNGEQSLFGRHIVHDSNQFDPPQTALGQAQSPIARQLGIGYTPAFRGALLSDLAAGGGWDAGWDTGASTSARTSLTVIPVGAGRVVLFGSGLFSAEESVANDITRLLLSGGDVSPYLTTVSAQLNAHQSQVVTMPLPFGNTGTAVRLLAVAGDDFVYFHTTVRLSG